MTSLFKTPESDANPKEDAEDAIETAGLGERLGTIYTGFSHFSLYTVGIGYCDYLGTWPKYSQYLIQKLNK